MSGSIYVPWMARQNALYDAETQRMIAAADGEFHRNQAALNEQSGSNFNSTGNSNSSNAAGNYGTGASNSNPNFSWNNEEMQKGMWQQAKDMSQLQLDNTLKTMGAASGYRSQELNLNDEITRRQSEQQFGFQKRLADDNYAFRDRDRAERERATDETMERSYQMKTETTNSARQNANRAFYGGGNRAFRSFNRFRARG
jgi:hypothetical protein